MTVSVELEQILNFALGTPEVGAVNFNILHGLLYEILKHLGIDKKKTELNDSGAFRSAYAVLSRVGGEPVKGAQTEAKDGLKQTLAIDREFSSSSPYSGILESKVSQIENRLKILDDLPSNDEILQRAKQRRECKTPVADLWQNINSNRRLGATEQGLEKLSGLLDTMMSEVNDVKGLAGDMEKMQKRIAELEKENKNLSERLSTLEGVDNTEDKENIRKLLKDLEKLRGKVNELPTKEDLDNLNIYVKWPQLEEALNARRSPSPKPKTPPPRSPPGPALPSPEAVEALQQIGEVIDKHEKLEKKVEGLEDEMPKKANLSDLEEFRKIPDVPDDVLQQLQWLRDGVEGLNKWKKKDGDALNAMQNLLLELQSELEKLSTTSKELIEEHNRKQKHIDALYNFTERLQENKADKEYVAMEVDIKADKRALENLISRAKFDQSIGTLDQTLQDALQRLDGYEVALKDTLQKLNLNLDLKLDRLELDPLKEYFEKRIKAMKCKHVDSQLNEDPAAGFRKALMRFQCISCDRPVEMFPGPIPPNPALPLSPGMPFSRTGRPYTTFELDQIRQINRGMYSSDDGVVPSTRACGGSHTVTYPQRRTARFNQYYCYREEDVPVPQPNRDETELMGHDGHVYKGRSEEQFPDVQQETSPRQKTQRATSAKRLSATPTRAASPNAVPRPRSAAPRSPREVDLETVTAQ